MKGKKLILFATAIALLLAIPAVVLAAVSQGNANTKPPTNIEAKFKFLDNGTTLTINATAKGLTSSKQYVSLIYGPGSLTKGLNSCRPNSPNTLGPIMFVGVWTVAADGTGALSATNITSNADGTPGHYVRLADIGTISVRLVTRNSSHHPLPTAQDHRPTLVVACGKVTS